MLFSDRPSVFYQNAPAHEVICQLRFPTILSINNVEPADFQEVIREEFPQYRQVRETPAPKIAGLGGPNPQLEQQPTVSNYTFLSADGLWKLNLTKDFIALSTLRYTGWRDFAHRLDRPLAEFIRLYKPAFFQRVGLRYLNLISRKKLGLEGCPWTELLAPTYTAVMQEPDVREADLLNCSTDLLLKLDSSCQAKIHAGPGRIQSNQPNVPQDPELKFILDMDLSMNGQTPCTLSAGALETLHGHSTRLFEGAVMDRLRSAMRPE